MKFKMPPKPKISRRAITALIFVVTSLTAGVLFAISIFSIQSVRHFTLVGETVYGEEYLIESSGVLLGEELFFADRAEAEKRILEAAPRLKSVKLRPSFFSTLVIEVEEEKGVYFSEINGDYYLLSQELRVLERSKSPDKYKAEATRFELYSNDIASAIEGEYVKFKNDRVKREVLAFAEEIESIPLGDHGVTALGFVDNVDRDAFVVLDGRLKIIFTGTDNAKEKIGFALTFISESDKKYEYSQIRIVRGEGGYEGYYSQLENVE